MIGGSTPVGFVSLEQTLSVLVAYVELIEFRGLGFRESRV